MKFLIGNYSSDTQSECMYINTTLNLLGSCKSTTWDEKSISAYDIFDLIDPDFYLTHVTNINMQALNYIKQSKKTELIINITGSKQQNIDLLETQLDQSGIKCAFFFHNSSDHGLVSKNYRLVNILYGADVFLSNSFPRYNIDNGIFVGNESEIKLTNGTCHTISTNAKLKNLVDICMPITQLSNIYDKYNNCIIRYFGKLVPQLFYDAAYYGNKVYYDLDNEITKQEAIEKINKLLRLDINITNPETFNKQDIKNSIKDRHTCLHRVKSMLSQLPCRDSVSNVDKLMEVYIKKD